MNLQRRHRSVLLLLLPLYYPLAMRIAANHVLGKREGKIWVQTFGSSITPCLMPCAARIHVKALLLPPKAPPVFLDTD